MALQVWLPLNGDIHNQGLNQNITVTNTGATVNNNGKLGKCYSYTTSQYMELNNLPFSSLTSCSISFWIKVTAKGSGGWLPFSGQTTSYYIMATSAGTGAFYHGSAGSGQKIYKDGILSTTPGALNEWHHYIITGVNLSTWTKFYINKYGGSWNFAGLINDIRIYDHVLSLKEIKEISKGLVLHYKLDNINNSSIESTLNLATYSTNYSNVNYNQAYNCAGWGGDAGTATYYKSGGYNNGPYKVYHKTATGSGGIYTKLDHDIHIESGKTYTMSIYVKASRNYTDSSYSFCINRNASTPYSSGNRYIVYGSAVQFTTEWKRISKTFTATDADAGEYGEMSIIYNDDVTDYYVYYSCFQIEENDHATPYVNGSRNLEETINLLDYSNLQGHGSSWTLQSSTFHGNVVYKNTVTNPSAGNNAGFSIRTQITNPNIANTTKLTLSFYKKLNTVYGKNLGGYVRVVKSDDSEANYSWSYNKANWANDSNSIGIWQQIYSTVTIPSGCKAIKYCYVYTDRATGGDCDFACIQLELKDHVTPYVNGTRETPGINNIVYDCSGYGNNGEIIGNFSPISNSIKYNSCTHFVNGSYIRVKGRPAEILPKDAITVNLWINFSTWSNPISCTESGGWNFENSNGIQFPVYIQSVGYKTANSGIAYSNLSNAWHMLTGVFNGTQVKIYIDGELKNTTETGSTNPISYYNNYLFISAEAQGNVVTPATSAYTGDISDVRIYCTALSDQDILELYHNPTNIDNQGNMFTFEFDESVISKQQILQTGITKIDNFVEIMDKIKVLDDGSVFLQILHHNNPASNLFTSTNCWQNNTENLYSALILLKTIFINQSVFEFLACEKLTSSGTEVQFRWSQTSNPALSSTITGKTIISGSVTHNEGLKTTGSYAVMHNGSTWWCACGSYTAYSGGIPGFNGIVTSGYLDLYIRIPEDVLKGNIGNFAKFFKKSILSTQFIEK